MLKIENSPCGELTIKTFPSCLAAFCLVFSVAGAYGLYSGQARVPDVILMLVCAAIPLFLIEYKKTVFSAASASVSCETWRLCARFRESAALSDVIAIRAVRVKGGGLGSSGLVDVITVDSQFSITAMGSMGSGKRQQAINAAYRFIESFNKVTHFVT